MATCTCHTLVIGFVPLHLKSLVLVSSTCRVGANCILFLFFYLASLTAYHASTIRSLNSATFSVHLVLDTRLWLHNLSRVAIFKARCGHSPSHSTFLSYTSMLVVAFVRCSCLAQMACMLLHIVVDPLETMTRSSPVTLLLKLLLLLLLVRFSTSPCSVHGIKVGNLFSTLHCLAQRLISCGIG